VFVLVVAPMIPVAFHRGNKGAKRKFAAGPPGSRINWQSKRPYAESAHAIYYSMKDPEIVRTKSRSTSVGNVLVIRIEIRSRSSGSLGEGPDVDPTRFCNSFSARNQSAPPVTPRVPIPGRRKQSHQPSDVPPKRLPPTTLKTNKRGVSPPDAVSWNVLPSTLSSA